ncbi:MAG: AAA family ATPase [Selenomonas sp.]|jgi:chromosome partitioning protein|nr:AAA family ATPase [Selenomonas sp.]
MKTFSLINKKGGVGKTTITVNLAYALAESCDLRVLVIDNDDQGNDTQFFGIEEGRTLADILLQKAGLSEVIQHTRYPKIDIVPSSEALLDANVVIIKDEDIVQQNILREAMKEVEEQYDICLIVVVKHFCNSTTYIFKNDIERECIINCVSKTPAV